MLEHTWKKMKIHKLGERDSLFIDSVWIMKTLFDDHL
jgi:hypothetical protein